MNVLLPFRTVGRERLPAPGTVGDGGSQAAFLRMVRTMDTMFDEKPSVLVSCGPTLTLMYRDVLYRWRDIAAGADADMAAVASRFRLCVYGTTEGRETAQITAVQEETGIWAVLQTVSGKPFDLLSGLGISLDTGSAALAAQLKEVVASLSHRMPCAAISRRHERLLRDCGLLAPTEGSFFAYAAWEPCSRRAFLASLTWENKAELWRTFLTGSTQPAEFDWLWENYYTDRGIFLLEWELTLLMTLEELGFTVERGDASFRVSDRQGAPRRFDIARGGPGEKLFLKLLFPLDEQ